MSEQITDAGRGVEEWGVSVDDVLRLAPHIHVPETGVSQPRDPQYGGAADTNPVSRDAVAGWITDVSRGVSLQLAGFRRIGPIGRQRIDEAACTVVTVGAAAWLVDAAHPTRAGINDAASYGNVLWTRYQGLLDDLVESARDLDGRPDGDDPEGEPIMQIRHSFPRTAFPDDMNDRW